MGFNLLDPLYITIRLGGKTTSPLQWSIFIREIKSYLNFFLLHTECEWDKPYSLPFIREEKMGKIPIRDRDSKFIRHGNHANVAKTSLSYFSQ